MNFANNVSTQDALGISRSKREVIDLVLEGLDTTNDGESARANMTLCKYVAGDDNSVYFTELVILLTSCGLLSPLVDSSLIWRTNSNSTMLIDHHRFAFYNFCPDVSSITSSVKYTELSSPATYLHRVMLALADLRALRMSSAT